VCPTRSGREGGGLHGTTSTDGTLDTERDRGGNARNARTATHGTRERLRTMLVPAQTLLAPAPSGEPSTPILRHTPLGQLSGHTTIHTLHISTHIRTRNLSLPLPLPLSPSPSLATPPSICLLYILLRTVSLYMQVYIYEEPLYLQTALSPRSLYILLRITLSLHIRSKEQLSRCLLTKEARTEALDMDR
jgi:hypothetical protein